MVSAVRAVVRVALLATFASAPAQADVVDPAPLDTVLIRHVHGGRVDYGALSRDPGPLRRYLAATENAAPERFSRDDQIAFWIDVYDARVLDGVIRHPGLASVLAADSAHGGPGFFKRTARSGGRALSLDAIEQELRSRWHEPRSHFALNCASTSCPALPPHALRGARLEAALDAATHGFLADSTKNRWGPDRVLELSAIFQWYGEDFRAAAGTVPGFVARYWTRGPRPSSTTPVRFLPYDWSLNGAW
jgi:hypothetical protein